MTSFGEATSRLKWVSRHVSIKLIAIAEGAKGVCGCEETVAMRRKKFTNLRYFLRTRGANPRWAMGGGSFRRDKDCPSSRTERAANWGFHLKEFEKIAF